MKIDSVSRTAQRCLLSCVLAVVSCLTACAQSPTRPEPIPLVETVDIPKFMGDWYVIAHIPTWFERNAYNAIEHYALAEDGQRINTTYRQRNGAFDGKLQIYRPTGYVQSGHANALWKMQFIWPFKAEYRIVGLAADYSWTIIGRNKRDYVWIMARQSTLDSELYLALLEKVAAMGYDLTQLREVPQQWPEATPALDAQ